VQIEKLLQTINESDEAGAKGPAELVSASSEELLHSSFTRPPFVGLIEAFGQSFISLLGAFWFLG
jgi:hypothetical protein